MAIVDTALRKRQQIANANRTMFMWVAAVSVVVGIAGVSSVFLVQKALFNEKVLSEKAKTASILTKNNTEIGKLKDEIRVLNTDSALSDAMSPGETQPVQVVLDALPSVANSSAFGASLQQKFLESQGISLESLTVDPVAGVEQSPDQSTSSPSTTNTGENQIGFRFSVSTTSDDASALKGLLQRIERSIRPIVLTSVKVETQSNKLVLSAEGYSYYEPAKSVQLSEKTVRP